MFAIDDQLMDVDQSAEYTMNMTNNTGIPLEYVEFELKHSKVIKWCCLICFLNPLYGRFICRNTWPS